MVLLKCPLALRRRFITAGWDACICGLVMTDHIPPERLLSSPFANDDPLHPMTTCLSPSTHPSRVARATRWLVLAVIMLGTVLSAIGNMNSHGLAAVGNALHADSSASDETHGHVHGDRGGEIVVSDQSAGPDHPHHQADHSHDNPNTLPIMWSSTAMLHRSWQLQVLPWIEMVRASRLERPPMG
jgi:hypothetical protein